MAPAPLLLFISLVVGLAHAGALDGMEEEMEESELGIGRSGGEKHKELNWTGICLTGKRQSPINLITANAICQTTTNLSFMHFDQKGTVTVRNNGETGVIRGFTAWDKQPRVKDGFLYWLQQLHFHWNMGNNGSEHAVDGKLMTAEMHLVFSLGNEAILRAKNKPQGLLVIGVLLEVVSGAKLGVYSDLVKVQDKADMTYVDVYFDLADKVPLNTDFFRYSGSLTTPSCDENVSWIVFKKPIGMAQEELDAMRSMHNHANHLIEHNDRQLQKQYDRPVYLHSKNCAKGGKRNPPLARSIDKVVV